MQGVEPVKFTQVKDYSTFDAEYALLNGNIVFHFFLPDDISHLADSQKYWTTVFPQALEACAMAYWEAQYPRLEAQFTEELNSWWLRCNGFAYTGDPEARVRKFLDKLDRTIEGQG